MKSIAAVFIAIAGANTPAALFAQSAPPSTAPAVSSTAGAAVMTLGEVRKVDKSASKITLRHEALANLDMPPMTMVFRAVDPKMLDAIKQGDKVRFVADKVNGQFVVTRIELAN